MFILFFIPLYIFFICIDSSNLRLKRESASKKILCELKISENFIHERTLKLLENIENFKERETNIIHKCYDNHVSLEKNLASASLRREQWVNAFQENLQQYKRDYNDSVAKLIMDLRKHNINNSMKKNNDPLSCEIESLLLENNVDFDKCFECLKKIVEIKNDPVTDFNALNINLNLLEKFIASFGNLFRFSIDLMRQKMELILDPPPRKSFFGCNSQ